MWWVLLFFLWVFWIRPLGHACTFEYIHTYIHITYSKGRMSTDNEAGREAAHGQPTLSYYSIHIVVCSGTPEISRFQLNGGTYTHKCWHRVMTVSFERSLSGVEIESPLWTFILFCSCTHTQQNTERTSTCPSIWCAQNGNNTCPYGS
jgi:hypothetical protein